MKTQHILGKLKISHPDKNTETAHHNLWKAADKHNFFEISDPDLWPMGVLNLRQQKYVTDGKLAATDFINKLAAVLKEDGIAELGLTGEITLVTSDSDARIGTVLHRVLVIHNEVLYAQASLQWENYTPVAF